MQAYAQFKIGQTPSTPTVKQNAAPIQTVQPQQPTQSNPSGAPKLESYAEFKGQNK